MENLALGAWLVHYIKVKSTGRKSFKLISFNKVLKLLKGKKKVSKTELEITKEEMLAKFAPALERMAKANEERLKAKGKVK